MTLLMISRLIVAFLQQKSRQSLLHFREGLRSTPQKKRLSCHLLHEQGVMACIPGQLGHPFSAVYAR